MLPPIAWIGRPLSAPSAGELDAPRVAALLRTPLRPAGRLRPLFLLGSAAFALHAVASGGSLPAPAGPRGARAAASGPGATEMNSKSWMAGVVVASAIGSSALGQDAVQWRVEDGGNGHWYEVRSDGGSWTSARASCDAVGGHLATVGNAAENAFIWNALASSGFYPCHAMLGGYQDPHVDDYSEPSGGWRWVTGEPMTYTAWYAGEPNNGAGGGSESFIAFREFNCDGTWNDIPDEYSSSDAYVVEWSADCNADGIVDYGQIRAGELVDTNANNIPDCCEQGSDCAVSAVEWSAKLGGNGHWYTVVYRYDNACWTDLRDAAAAAGGHLATLTTSEENAFAYHLARMPQGFNALPTYLGASQPGDACEPACGWNWVTGEPWQYTNWSDLGCCVYDEDALELNTTFGSNGSWRDDRICRPGPIRALVEWSADCNADGIVDYGQIRAGELVDTNANNIPDCCEQGSSCGCIADLDSNGSVDGIDLAVILNNWGTNGGKDYPNADIDGDGTVAASDLSEVLNSWGPCR